MSGATQRRRRVLVTGGTGYLGRAVLAELAGTAWAVDALVRDERGAATVSALRASPVRGLLERPGHWWRSGHSWDALIHLGTPFGPDAAAVDAAFLDAITTRPRPIHLLYTGGTWLYGETGDRPATEGDELRPPADFRWMTDGIERLRATPRLRTVVMHPANVYHRDGGAVAAMVTRSGSKRPLVLPQRPQVRWPMIHRDDLASAYRAVLDLADPAPAYNLCAEQGVPVADLARAILDRRGRNDDPVFADCGHPFDPTAAGAGPLLDQRMDGTLLRRHTGWRPTRRPACDLLSRRDLGF